MQRQWTEGALLRGLRAGRAEAVAALLDLFGDRLLRGAYLLIHDHHGAEDVVQESFVAALRNIKGFRGESGLYWHQQFSVDEGVLARYQRREMVVYTWRPGTHEP